MSRGIVDRADEELDDAVLAELGEHGELGLRHLVGGERGDEARLEAAELRAHGVEVALHAGDGGAGGGEAREGAARGVDAAHAQHRRTGSNSVEEVDHAANVVARRVNPAARARPAATRRYRSPGSSSRRTAPRRAASGSVGGTSSAASPSCSRAPGMSA